jgi:hypothetical protein
MALLRSRTRNLAAGFGLVALVAVAAVGALFATGEIGGRQVTGTVVIMESQLARFDREVHARLADATRDPRPGETGLCLELAAAEGIAPGSPVVLYDEGNFVIGRGALGRARMETPRREPYEDIQVCVFRFYIDDIRNTESVAVDIGGTRRATYDASAFNGRHWVVEIPLGSSRS